MDGTTEADNRRANLTGDYQSFAAVKEGDALRGAAHDRPRVLHSENASNTAYIRNARLVA